MSKTFFMRSLWLDQEEKINVYTDLAIVLHLGNITFKVLSYSASLSVCLHVSLSVCLCFLHALPMTWPGRKDKLYTDLAIVLHLGNIPFRYDLILGLCLSVCLSLCLSVCLSYMRSLWLDQEEKINVYTDLAIVLRLGNIPFSYDLILGLCLSVCLFVSLSVFPTCAPYDWTRKKR